MKIGGDSIMLVTGLINLGVIGFQMASGLRWISAPPKIHRKTGILLAAIAGIHAAVGILFL